MLVRASASSIVRKPRIGPASGEIPTYRRSALAGWICDTERGAGALLARVIVNRLWQHHFGRGIVETPSDFGSRGARPTLPKLLEWLANELVRTGWDLKHLHRLMLSSASWRQAALAESPTPLDQGLFRGHRIRRLESEAIRDALLATSGVLDSQMFGPGTLVERQKRRSVYFRVKRSQLIPMMTLFDSPDALQSLGRRAETTVAPQALALMNAKHVRELATDFARRLTERIPISRTASSRQYSAIVRLAYRGALGRMPTDSELSRSIDFIRQQQTVYATPRERITALPAADAIVVRLDATQLANQKQPTKIRRWSSVGVRSDTEGLPTRTADDDIAFSAVTDEFPILESTATPRGKPAVRFGPAPTILRTNHPRLNFGTGDFSITVLFRIDASAGNDHHILGKDNYSGTASYSGYFFQQYSDRLKFCTRRVEPGKGHSVDLETEPFIRKGQWYRATGVRHSGTVSLYVDDAESADVSRREPEPIDINNAAGFKIGDMDESLSGSLNGSIAEVLVFDRALTSDEVRVGHDYLRQKYLLDDAVNPLEMALADFCQALFCLNEFIYVE